ncbi:hypothetical protein [Streptacidiphilus sp. PAMC 29251]
MHQPSVPDQQQPVPVRERCRGQIVRVTTDEVRIAFAARCCGAATVTARRTDLVMVLGPGEQLLGAHVSAVIDTTALTDRDVLLVAWRCAREPGPDGAG